MPMSKSHLVSQTLELSYKDYSKKGKSISNLKIGKYVVYEELGRGAFGSVFKGMNDQTNQLVAIKVLDLQAVNAEKSEYVKKVKRRLIKTQAQMMKKCESDHLIKCYDVYENKSLKLMVIEYCNGGNLDDQISKNQRIPQEDATKILIQILNGLAELHRNGIIHRDLKAQNILVHDGIYKIGDFGFSKQLDSNSAEEQIKGTKLGTISTMAPEVIQGKHYGLQADIWSIGVIFYNMLFGKVPFQKLTYQQIIEQIHKKDILQTIKKNSKVQISQEAISFIRLCLIKDSQKRLNWQNITSHKLFQKQSQQNLMTTMRRSIFLDIKNMQNLDKTNIQINDADLNVIPQQTGQSQPKGTTKVLAPIQLKLSQIIQKQQSIQLSNKNKAYSWSRRAHFQCLKTELIMKEIINPLQEFSSKFLQKRQIIQILYLLSTRCFHNMSFKNSQIKYQQQQIVQDLLKLIKNLYERVKKTWEKYQNKLFEKQSQIFEILKDKFITFTKKESMQEKDKFLTGNERKDQKSNGDYTKKQQIQFTQSYFDRELQDIKKQKKTTNKMLNYIKNYQRICSLTLKQVGDQYFKKYVQKNFNSA